MEHSQAILILICSLILISLYLSIDTLNSYGEGNAFISINSTIETLLSSVSFGFAILIYYKNYCPLNCNISIESD